VAGKGDFGGRGEDADVRGVGGVLRWEDEGGFGVVEFFGEGLHLRGGEAARVGDHGEGVAAEARGGEDVDGDVVDGRHFGGACEFVV